MLTLPTIQPEKPTVERHPKGTNAKILLLGVNKPFIEDAPGSRVRMPWALYSPLGQVTRNQEGFSPEIDFILGAFHLIAKNIPAPIWMLYCATLAEIVRALQGREYDIVGLNGIYPTTEKVGAIAKLVRQYQPRAKIVVGGHVTCSDRMRDIVDCDIVVDGDGIEFFREYLGLDTTAPVRQAGVYASNHYRVMGVSIPMRLMNRSQYIVWGLGCPRQCGFCASSAKFKGHIAYYKTGKEFYESVAPVMAETKAHGLMAMDENFANDVTFVREFLDCMRRDNQSWGMEIFASADALAQFDDYELLRLGFDWVWTAPEGRGSAFKKNKGIDTIALGERLKANGTFVQYSFIIGLFEHTTVGQVIDNLRFMTEHDGTFAQAMLNTPLPGTPFHRECVAKGLMKEGVPIAMQHGQECFNYTHPVIPEGMEAQLLERSFREEYETNGPSFPYRTTREQLRGWKNHHNHPEEAIRRRFAALVPQFETFTPAALQAAEMHFHRKGDGEWERRVRELKQEVIRTFGTKAALSAKLGGPLLYAAMRKEAFLQARGIYHEPATVRDRNEQARSVELHEAQEKSLLTRTTTFVSRFTRPSLEVQSG